MKTLFSEAQLGTVCSPEAVLRALMDIRHKIHVVDALITGYPCQGYSDDSAAPAGARVHKFLVLHWVLNSKLIS